MSHALPQTARTRALSSVSASPQPPPPPHSARAGAGGTKRAMAHAAAATSPAANSILRHHAHHLPPAAAVAAVGADEELARYRDATRVDDGASADDATTTTHSRMANPEDEYLSIEEAALYTRAPEPDRQRRFTVRPVSERVIDNVPTLSCQATNTASSLAKASGMCHNEGGWPTSVDPEEADDRIKYVKRVQRDESYLRAVAELLTRAMPPLRTNSALDVYATYFGEDYDLRAAAAAADHQQQQQQRHGRSATSGADDDGGAVPGTADDVGVPDDNDDDEGSPYRAMRGGKGKHIGPDGFQVPQYAGDAAGRPATFRVVAKMVSPMSDQSRASQAAQLPVALQSVTTVDSVDPVVSRSSGFVKDLCWLCGDTSKFAAVYPQTDSAAAAEGGSMRHGTGVGGADTGGATNSGRAGAVWDVSDATSPVAWLKAPAASNALTCIAGSVRDAHVVVAGSSSGIVAVYDTREKHRDAATNSTAPVLSSTLLHGHGGPVEAVRCVVSKGLEFFTGGADGQVLYWDARNLSAPTERMQLTSPANVSSTAQDEGADGADAPQQPALYAVSCLDYDAVQAASAKIVVGTADGTVVLCSRASGRAGSDRIAARLSAHYGPVRSVSRHPMTAKTFLSVGDWGVKLFSEELRSPIVQTPSQSARLTAGKWHPTRSSMFLTGSQDGVLHAWDILVSLDRPVLSLPLDAGAAVTSIAPHPTGALVAAGSADGSIALVRLPDEMARANRREERAAVSALIDRETARERTAVAIAEAKARNQQRRGGEAASPRRRRGVFVAEAAATSPGKSPARRAQSPATARRELSDEDEDDDAASADPDEPLVQLVSHRSMTVSVLGGARRQQQTQQSQRHLTQQASRMKSMRARPGTTGASSPARKAEAMAGVPVVTVTDDPEASMSASRRGAAAAEEEEEAGDAVITAAIADAEAAFLAAVGMGRRSPGRGPLHARR